MTKSKQKYLITQTIVLDGGSNLDQAIKTSLRALKGGISRVMITDSEGKTVWFKARNYQTNLDFYNDSDNQ